jgi:hypothetical protein
VLGAGCRRILIEGGIPIMAIGHVFFGSRQSLVPCTTSKLPNYNQRTENRGKQFGFSTRHSWMENREKKTKILKLN